VVDGDNTVTESNESNNSQRASITVRAKPPRRAHISVLFESITIYNDADPAACGELWLDIKVSGTTDRWPGSGTKHICDGSTYDIMRRVHAELTEGQAFTIYVNGTDKDAPGFPLYDENDAMGFVSKSYQSSDTAPWGNGTHDERSNCPDGCYTIHYSITYSWLN
jgi:hypothetical protein